MPRDKGDGGLCVKVSEIDQPYFDRNRWSITNNGYVCIRGGKVKGKQVLLHRLIMKAKADQEVHHLNHDKLDNRRENLELTTASDHQRHHSSKTVERNILSRVYSEFGFCIFCKKEYKKHPSHRGRQKFCSKRCAAKNQWGKK